MVRIYFAVHIGRTGKRKYSFVLIYKYFTFVHLMSFDAKIFLPEISILLGLI